MCNTGDMPVPTMVAISIFIIYWRIIGWLDYDAIYQSFDVHEFISH